ncbi:Tn7-like transposition protein D [Trichormus variabilis ATCC 29413]|uniref:Tn7-like transposition protein D n=2 Tax=Anabaena variabilis TaxID=264691 RepID=Q3M7E0_TRIV2|nr:MULTISPECIES: TnsD family Tn7-like transposition protein [Nostocaceae]ABA23096.1 Tn7-like transposition protein D [Trichormus variabilis ATCC 29413]MBC1214080.1 TniQ family protein [Trichormus variabilis ARAD]MBC1257963.1 TniQ family protein [Trichormus variabilis V5]MBC1265719.1 TniQ family protein [Trichormus variabilis FSR]MBC1303341.1 TniQ family protein [Trichormus variabilis N2B]
MLSFFPTLYPDELLYSTLARYHIRSGNKSFKQTDLELFGYSSQQICKITLTNNLNYLVKNLPLRSQQKVENLLQNHTLYSFYATLLMPQEAWLLKNSMSNKFSGSILDFAKVANNSSDDSKKFLKFCPECLEKDTQKYGEPYWHRIHQVPGILVCPIHRVVLHNSCIEVESKGIHYHAASIDNCLLANNVKKLTNKTVETLSILAHDINWLIHSSFAFQGLAWLRAQYQRYLLDKGLLKTFAGGKFKFNDCGFAQLIFEFYGQESLEALNPKLTQNQGKYFSHCLFGCDLNPAIDRITHILMIKFLANSIEEFFQS